MTDDDLRDDFGDELTEALRLRSRAEAPEVAVTAVMPRDPRVRARRISLATLVALVLVVFGIGVTAASRPGQPHIRVADRSPATTLPSSIEGLTTGVQDWTWVNDDHGWALVRHACGSSVCVTLRETVDGGTTWATLPTPGALDVSSVRFATPKIGWLFGPGLFETADGGHTWTRVPGATVTDVEAAHGIAMRLSTTDRDCGGGCEYRIDRQRLGTSSWERVPSGAEYSFPRLLLQGSDAYDVNIANRAGAGEAFLRQSGDAGATWNQIDDPCAQSRAGDRTASASAAPDGVLVVLCAPVGGTPAAVQISADRGKTFGPAHAIPDASMPTGPIAAASAGTIAVAYSDRLTYGVLVTHDGGISWQATLVLATTPTGPNGLNPSLGWQDARTARASFNRDVIWTTRDGGRSWTQHRVAPR